MPVNPDNTLSMKGKLVPALVLLSVFSFGATPHKNNSVLATGKWYKIAVRETGVYKITYENFASMGFDLSQVNDSNIRIYGNGGGMLPESNLQPRIDDLREIAIQVVDGATESWIPAIMCYFTGKVRTPGVMITRPFCSHI